MNSWNRKQRRFVQLTGATAALLAVSVVLAGCSGTPASSGSDGAAKAGGTLTVAMAADVVSLDPQLQGDLTSMSVADNIFDTLTIRDAKNQLVAGLATKWEAVNPLTWRFTIRKGVTFQNGEPLDAKAVAFSVNRMLNPATKSPIVELINVKDAKVVDANTVDFEMKAPDPIIPAKVSLFGGVIVPPKYIQEKGDAEFAKHPIGTGPFSFVSRQQDNEIVLKANKSYWGTKPSYDKLVFKVMPDPAASLAALQSGQVDIVTGITKDAANQLKGSSDTKVKSTPGIRTYCVHLDTITSGPLAKAEVRQALNYAVDVPTLIKTVMGGAAVQTPTLIPSSVFGFDKSVDAFKHSTSKAKQLLASAGYPDGFSTKLTASSGDSALAQAIAGQLAEVGVKVDVKLVDPVTSKSDIITLNKRADGAMYLVANSGWTLDAESYLQSVLRSDRRSSRWDNPRVNDLVTLEETSVDSATRLKAFSELQQLLKSEAPFTYLFNVNNTYAMRSNVDWTMPMMGINAMSSAKVK
jgi:peptide/nickel transport system substrate-binding protein